MPDTYGNLSCLGDFTEGLQIRLYSFLEPSNVVLGCQGGHTPYVHRLSNGPAPENTIFRVGRVRRGTFSLTQTHDNLPLYFGTLDYGKNYILCIGSHMVDQGSENYFTVDMLLGPWFALNKGDRSLVVDVSRSDTTQGNAVIAYPWNNGDNQRWRAEIVR